MRCARQEPRPGVRSWCCRGLREFRGTCSRQVFELGTRVSEGLAEDLPAYVDVRWRSQLGRLDDALMRLLMLLLSVEPMWQGVADKSQIRCEAGNGPRLQMTCLASLFLRLAVEHLLCLRGGKRCAGVDQAFQAYYFRSASRRHSSCRCA